MAKKTIVIIAAVILLIAVIIGWSAWHDTKKLSQLKTFANCITKSGAKFYGAFWCPHCQAQKAEFETLFGGADKNLPYIECSTPDSNGQLQVCTDAGIKVYPTWKFADGTTHEGEMTLQELADKTKCIAP
jgi:thiol-disulfide isomerase/thioredoxin